MKTIKQLADEIGVSKQRVYRYIKNHITDAHRSASIIRLDDALETLIKERFLGKNTPRDARHVVHQNSIIDSVNDVVLNALLKQLEEKDRQLFTQARQVEQLTNQLDNTHRLLDQQQQLQMKLQLQLERKKQRWFHFPWNKK